MEKKYEDFYQKIRNQINNFLEKKNFAHADILMLAPDFFHLLVKMTLDNRVPKDKKIKLAAALVYFISPLDFLPEAILGPIGYMDDLAITAYVLNDFINSGYTEILYEHWAGKGDVLATIQNVLTVADHYLGQGLWERLKKKVKEEEK